MQPSYKTDIRAYEAMLRDAGYSRKRSKAIAANGFAETNTQRGLGDIVDYMEQSKSRLKAILTGQTPCSCNRGLSKKSDGIYDSLNTELNEAVKAGKTHKIWVASGGNSRESHAAADGQMVAINDHFSVGDDDLFLPGDPGGSIGETINCQCNVEFVTQEAKPIAEAAAVAGAGAEPEVAVIVKPVATVDPVAYKARPCGDILDDINGMYDAIDREIEEAKQIGYDFAREARKVDREAGDKIDDAFAEIGAGGLAAAGDLLLLNPFGAVKDIVAAVGSAVQNVSSIHSSYKKVNEETIPKYKTHLGKVDDNINYYQGYLEDFVRQYEEAGCAVDR